MKRRRRRKRMMKKLEEDGHVVAVEGQKAAAGWHLYCLALTSSSPQMPRSDLCVCSRLPTVLIPSASCLHFCPRRIWREFSQLHQLPWNTCPPSHIHPPDLCYADTWTRHWWVTGDRAELFLLFTGFEKHFRAIWFVPRVPSACTFSWSVLPHACLRLPLHWVWHVCEVNCE